MRGAEDVLAKVVGHAKSANVNGSFRADTFAVNAFARRQAGHALAGIILSVFTVAIASRRRLRFALFYAFLVDFTPEVTALTNALPISVEFGVGVVAFGVASQFTVVPDRNKSLIANADSVLLAGIGRAFNRFFR